MDNYLEKAFGVDSLHVDYKKEYDICGLLRHFHEAAEKHAYDLGIDANTIYDKYGAIWIISRIRVDMDFMPKWQQEITVRTYPLAPGLVRMDREAAFLCSGKNFARLSSEWCMLGKDNGRPRRPDKTGYPAGMTHLTERQTSGYSRMESAADGGELAFVHTVRISDLDMNVHMNNVAYVRLACDAFSLSELEGKRIVSFEIAFKSQSYEGDDIKVFRKQLGGNTYIVSGCKSSGEPVFDTQFVIE